MKKQLIWVICIALLITGSYAQDKEGPDRKEQAISFLIDQYAKARETKDSVLLRQVLTEGVDQLVSTGEWRRGFDTAKKGMLRSSSTNPGSRTLTVDQIRFLNDKTAVADARYEIQNTDGTLRKMWSTFIVVYEDNLWKITAIRNMLPTKGS